MRSDGFIIWVVVFFSRHHLGEIWFLIIHANLLRKFPKLAHHGAGICKPTFARTKSPSFVGIYTIHGACGIQKTVENQYIKTDRGKTVKPDLVIFPNFF